jgi:hypothetical protein
MQNKDSANRSSAALEETPNCAEVRTFIGARKQEFGKCEQAQRQLHDSEAAGRSVYAATARSTIRAARCGSRDLA